MQMYFEALHMYRRAKTFVFFKTYSLLMDKNIILDSFGKMRPTRPMPLFSMPSIFRTLLSPFFR